MQIPLTFSVDNPAPTTSSRRPLSSGKQSDDDDEGTVTVAPPDFLVWDRTPTREDLLKAYPREAAENATPGHVVLRCKVTKSGDLVACDAEQEQPTSMGFGRAAKSLTHAFKFAVEAVPSDLVGKFDVDLPVTFLPAERAPHVLEKPNWIRTIPPDKIQELFPPKAADAGLTTGRAVLDCVADARGMMTGCTVVQEDPAGMEFGPAALRVAAVMGVNPWTETGEPVDGMHVRFALRLNRAPDPAPAK